MFHNDVGREKFISMKTVFIILSVISTGFCVEKQTLVRPFENEPNEGEDIGSRIIGGEEIDIRDAPYQASLRAFDSHFCGAVIINDRWALTAAHCLYGASDYIPFSIRVGSSNQYEGVSYVVSDFILHYRYDNDLSSGSLHDIALLKLASSIAFDETTQPIDLSLHPENFEFDKCWISGWGYTIYANRTSPVYLQGGQTHVIPQSRCGTDFYGIVRISATSHVCVDDLNTMTCNGDSGGPLVCLQDGHKVVVGLTSFSLRGCAYTTVFNRVGTYRNWILKTIAANSCD